MKLEQALKDIEQNSDDSETRIAISQFLYKGGRPSNGVSEEARGVLAHPHLAGSKFKLITHNGWNNVVFANSQAVFKLSTIDTQNDTNYDEHPGAIPIMDIPKD